MTDDLTKQSKFISLVLRHKPDEIGITLDPSGWVSIEELARKSRGKLREDIIRAIVATSDKQRFAVSADGKRIRANQGHSIDVDLGLQELVPPDVLFHGTAIRFIESIRAKGLVSGKRQHVHLSADADTAAKVGQRHGAPVVLHVRADQMAKDGIAFFRSENGVWLTHHVPYRYLVLPESS